MTDGSPRAVHATVRGRVQGVGFRVSVVRSARASGLAGWVRNTVEGGVEVWAQGESDAIDRFVRFLEIGPMAARVDGVVVTPGVINPAMTSFDVRY
jgi:acylphosphatase